MKGKKSKEENQRQPIKVCNKEKRSNVKGMGKNGRENRKEQKKK